MPSAADNTLRQDLADALAEVLEGDGPTPAARVAEGAREVHWLVDEAAAARLTSTALHRPS